MNDLEKHFTNNTGRLIHKWEHYFDIYDRHFSRYRNTDVHVLEFGVSQGGSLQMWKDYFGPKCRIFGVDINHHCKSLQEDRVQIFIGDQEDRYFLKSIAASIPRVDILIDDGGHTMKQQIHTFEELFDEIDENGIYLCEDLHSSYSSEYGGGFQKPGTFIEYSKTLIDKLNAWHSRTPRLEVSRFTKSAYSLHFYDNILVIEKAPKKQSSHHKTGSESIPAYSPPRNLWKKVKGRIERGMDWLLQRSM